MNFISRIWNFHLTPALIAMTALAATALHIALLHNLI